MKKEKIKKVIMLIVALFPFTLVIGLLANLVTNREENVIHPTFEVGGLDTNGKYVECEDTLFTPDAIKFNEFSIKLDFKSDMKYQLYFYDVDDELLFKTEMRDRYYEYITEKAKYVRVLLEPTWDKDVKEEDKKINVLEKVKLVNQVTICAKANEESEDFDMINFTIYHHLTNETFSLKCEDGMTWEDFINSEYNYYTNGAGYNQDLLLLSDSEVNLITGPSAILTVNSNELICDGVTYTSVSP